MLLYFFFPPIVNNGEIENMEITEDVAETLVMQDRIFKESFLRLIKIGVKGQKEVAENEIVEIAEEIDKVMNGKNKLVCLFVLSYLLSTAFTLEEYEKIEKIISNYTI